jgi:[ribosomal protein S5]-alanine N-acetyltransferase
MLPNRNMRRLGREFEPDCEPSARRVPLALIPQRDVIGGRSVESSLNFPEEVETERLRLRWPTEADAEEIFARFASDPEVTRYMLWKPHRSVEDTYAFLRKRDTDPVIAGGQRWLLRLKTTGLLLGMIGCRRIEPHVLQFGYCLARDSWGQGYATEATRAMVPIWIALPEIERVQAFCDPTNVASAKVLERSGLQYEGTLRRYVVSPNFDNEARDARLYAAVKGG